MLHANSSAQLRLRSTFLVLQPAVFFYPPNLNLHTSTKLCRTMCLCMYVWEHFRVPRQFNFIVRISWSDLFSFTWNL